MINPFNKIKQFKNQAQKYKNESDKQELEYVLAYLNADNVVFDIGAHQGMYSYWMSQAVGDGGKIIAIEPQIRLVKYMQNIFPKIGASNIEVHNYAVSNRTGVGYITIPRVYGKTS